MSKRTRMVPRRANRFALTVVYTLMLALCSVSLAGHQTLFGNSVGGISIDPAGVVGEPVARDRDMALKELRSTIKPAPADARVPTELRMISLRALEEAIGEALRTGLGTLPEEMRFLAGLQRIKYVFLYPEHGDIVLAGPGEGWKVDENANIVGVTTGRPVLRLEDLIVAFRTARNANAGHGISCSIDPTQGGMAKFQQYIGSLKSIRGFNKKIAAQAMGPQKVTVTGVPANSRFARMLVAADYKMKRLGMNLEESPVRGMPSYIDMIKAKGERPTSLTPRWWLACNYEPLARSEDGLAWELRGQGVKCLTEDSFIGKDGDIRAAGRVNATAQKWADTFTEKYDELSAKLPIFGQLRNMMDLCVIAALIEKEAMLDKVGMELPLLTNPEGDLKLAEWHAPKTIGTQISALKAGRNFIITASGGVQVESWEVASRSEMHGQVEDIRARAKATGKKSWWW